MSDDSSHPAGPAPSTVRAASVSAPASAHDDSGREWRVLVDGALAGTVNMARDHALAAALRPGAGTVRFYRWRAATLSLGRNEPFTVGYRELLRDRPQMEVVRRPTGGRAVIHDRELTYAVALPARAFGGPRRAYRKVSEGLVKGLRQLGVPAQMASGRSLPPDAGPCFREAAAGEVVVGGRKIVGSAQVRIGDALLQHGSLLLVADQEPLLARTAVGAGGVAGWRAEPGGSGAGEEWKGGMHAEARNGEAGAVTLAEVLPEVPAWDRLVEALAGALAGTLAGRWGRGEMTAEEMRLAAGLEQRYDSREWTWRR